MDNYNYPEGSDTPDAPWNDRDAEPANVEVTLSTTLSKVCNLLTTNYIAERDEDGWFYNFDNDQTKAARDSELSAADALSAAVRVLTKIIQSHILDANLPLYKQAKEAIELCSDWEEDEFEAYTD